MDDRQERYFLELKSECDLSSKSGQAKIAKFILGAANRQPEQAMRRLEGHAILVLGVTRGAVKGIDPFEAKDLDRAIRSFVGAPGPQWDYERIPAEGDRDVIVIVVDPPRPGDPIWTCLKDGEGLRDGGIYIRADGETREAKGDEVRALLRRAEQRQPDAELSVELVGSANALTSDEAVLDEYVARERARLQRAYDVATSPSPHPGLAAALRVQKVFEREEDRSPEAYFEAIASWEARTRAVWQELLDEVAGWVLPAAQLRVVNHASLFMERVEVEVHLEGAVRAVEKLDREYDPLDRLPSAPRPWGPRPAMLIKPPYSPTTLSGLSHVDTAPIGSGVVDFKNSGSVDLTSSWTELRPKTEYLTDDDVFVLVTDSSVPPQVEGTWRLTAAGHHTVYEGRLSVPLNAVMDFTGGMRSLLFPEDSGDSQE